MVVNLCNALVDEGCETHLCTTRRGGPLEKFLDPRVRYLALQRSRTLDMFALLRLRKYIRKHEIQIVHAHSSSYFVAILIRFLTRIRVVWHDHYGDSEHLTKRPTAVLRIFSQFFDAVVVVNELLLKWAEKHLCVDKAHITYLPNFPELRVSVVPPALHLPGKMNNRIVCTARLHPQKDHPNLLYAFSLVRKQYPDAHLLLVGEEHDDLYSMQLRCIITEHSLENNVHLLGGRSDVAEILSQCIIGVLSSNSEGLPVSLLEYGLAGLGVVCTDVGACSDVLRQGKFGELVERRNPEALANGILRQLRNNERRESIALQLQNHVNTNYSRKSVAKQLTTIYDKLCLETLSDGK